MVNRYIEYMIATCIGYLAALLGLGLTIIYIHPNATFNIPQDQILNYIIITYLTSIAFLILSRVLDFDK